MSFKTVLTHHPARARLKMAWTDDTGCPDSLAIAPGPRPPIFNAMTSLARSSSVAG